MIDAYEIPVSQVRPGDLLAQLDGSLIGRCAEITATDIVFEMTSGVRCSWSKRLLDLNKPTLSLPNAVRRTARMTVVGPVLEVLRPV